MNFINVFSILIIIFIFIYILIIASVEKDIRQKEEDELRNKNLLNRQTRISKERSKNKNS